MSPGPDRSDAATWRAALAHGLLVASLMLAALYHWFAADRYRVFLYYHDMGPLVPTAETAPFGFATASRYWMAALVAGGGALAVYMAACWILGRVRPGYRPPTFWRTWLAAAAALAIGVPAITMSVNQPTLPGAHAARVTLAALVAVALAVAPGRFAAERPRHLVWLAAYGWALALFLIGASALERVPDWLERGATHWVWMTAALLGAGVGWMIVVSALHAWRRAPVPSAAEVLAAGLAVTYLVLPLVHHVSFTNGYGYITDGDNFFSRSLPLQLTAWLAAAALAVAATRTRRHLVGPETGVVGRSTARRAPGP